MQDGVTTALLGELKDLAAEFHVIWRIGRSGHFGLGKNAELIDAMHEIANAAARVEGDDSRILDSGKSALGIAMIGGEHLAEVEARFAHAEQFGLDESGAAIIPAETCLALMPHLGYWELVVNGE